MGVRATIVMDEDIVKKIRVIQAKRISAEQKSVSFSEVVNDLLRKEFK